MFIVDCFFKLKEYQFALADFSQAQILHKRRSSGLDYRLSVSHYTLGLKAYSDKKMLEAADHFSSAIKHSPYTAKLYTCRARTKYELKVHCSDTCPCIVCKLLLL